MTKKRKVNYHVDDIPAGVIDHDAVTHYFITDPDKKDNKVASIRTTVKPEKVIPYFDDKNHHGYNADYLRHLTVTQGPDYDPHALAAANHLLHNRNVDGPRYQEAKKTIDDMPRETLWHVSPKVVTVGDAMSARGYGPQVMKLLGIMHSQHPDALIQPSSSLSVHSSKLAKHAKNLGFPITAPPYNHNMDVVNDIDFEDKDYSDEPTERQKKYFKETRIPDDDVKRGEAVLKSYLSPQFEARKEERKKALENSAEWRHSQGIYMLPGFGDEDK